MMQDLQRLRAQDPPTPLSPSAKPGARGEDEQNAQNGNGRCVFLVNLHFLASFVDLSCRMLSVSTRTAL